MKIKFFGVLLALLYICAYTTQAQKVKTDAHLTGHVTDKITGEHIPYVSISIKGTNIGTVTDATGHFLIKHIPVGNYTVTASLVGYQNRDLEITMIRNKTIELKFELEERALNVDEVVVTGSRNEVNRLKSATIVNVLSPKLFESTASNNVAEVLNFQSGLRVEYNCSNCGVPQLRINGLEGQYSQILLDSRPIFSSLAGVYGLEQMPAAMIERVEVIRGGGSALFGSNAIGGVVNIITKEPLRNSISLANNTMMLNKNSLDVNTSINGSFVTDDYKLGVYLFGMVKSRDSYDRDEDGFSEIPKINSETIGFRGYYKMNSWSKLTAEYHHIREFRRGGNLMERPPHEADIAEQLQHSINGGGLRYDIFSHNMKHRASIYTSMQDIDRQSYFGTDQNLDAYGTTTDRTFIAGGQYAVSFDRMLFMPSDLTVGAEYNNNHLNDKMLGYDREINQKSRCYGGFIQNEWKNDKLSLLIGARADKHNLIDNVMVSPRVNVRYTPSKLIGMRVSYSSGYRAPQAYDEDLHVAAVGGNVSIISIDPNLRPEYSKSMSASVDLYHKFGFVEANLLVEGFYTDLKDVFKLDEKGTDAHGNTLLERRNASGAVVKGINTELKLGFTPRLILDAGYTFQSSRYKDPVSLSLNHEIAAQRKMFRAPDQYGYANLNFRATKKLTTSVNCTYTGSMLVQHFGADDGSRVYSEVTTPDFWDMGVRVAYDLQLSPQTKLQISGGVKNVFDSFQRDIDKGVMRDAGYIYGPAMPRALFLGLKLMI